MQYGNPSFSGFAYGSGDTGAGGGDTAPTLTGPITVSAITTTTATLAWSAGTDDTGVAGYRYSINGGSTYTDAGDVLTVNLTGLTAGTTYALRVVAYDAAGNQSAPISGTLTTEAGSVTPTTRQVVLTLTSDGATPVPGLSSLRWAFFDQTNPGSFTAPSAKGTAETTDGAGSLVIDISGTTLAAGAVGWLVITDSDGSTTQTPSARAFSGPVLVS